MDSFHPFEDHHNATGLATSATPQTAFAPPVCATAPPPTLGLLAGGPVTGADVPVIDAAAGGGGATCPGPTTAAFTPPVCTTAPPTLAGGPVTGAEVPMIDARGAW